MNNTTKINNDNNSNAYNIMKEDAIKEKYLRWHNMKINAAKAVTVLLIIAALFISRSDFNGTIKPDKLKTVYDNDQILSLYDTIDVIEARNSAMSELTRDREAKIFVVIEKDRSNYNDLKNKADKLFKSYDAGDNGMLFIVTAANNPSSNFLQKWGESIWEFFADLFGGGTQPYAYHKGRNLNKLDDGKIDEIIKINFENSQNYKTGNYSDAVLDTYNALADYFDEYYNINSKNYKSEILEIYPVSVKTGSNATIVGVIAVFGIFFVILGVLTRKKSSEASRVYKKPFWFSMF
ncbi:MAG: TPM domain-containing protein [Oscillospiraceae bacterium]|nr:TPM domain-containing protein [Oscillospiraceae bacterium]